MLIAILDADVLFPMLLRDTLLGKQHPCGALFSFDRLKRSP